MAFSRLQNRLLAIGIARAAFLENWLEHERDRLVLWSPVCFGAGIIGWYWLGQPGQWIALICTGLGVGALGFGLGWMRRTGRAIALAGLLVAAGCLAIWGRAERVAAPVIARPTIMVATGRITRIDPQPAKDSLRLWIRTEQTALLPGLLVRLTLEGAQARRDWRPGDLVRVRARLVPPPPPIAPGGYDFARQAWFLGLGAIGKALDPPVLLARGEAALWATWRTRLTAHVQHAVGGPAGGVAAALVTGDQGGITPEDAEAMRRSGLAHLLSISGLHVSAVVAGTYWLIIRLLALSRRIALFWPVMHIAASAAAIVAIAYTLLAGAEVPTLRSCFAAILVLIAMVIGREALTLRLVASGAMIVLILFPEGLVGPSFQLSFAAVTALVAWHELAWVKARFKRREDDSLAQRVMRGLALIFLTGLIIELALTPIALFHFHKAGLLGALVNVVAIPFTTFVIMPLEALALSADLIGLGGLVWPWAGVGIDVLLSLARWAGSVESAILAIPAYPGWILGVIVLSQLWLALWVGPVRWFGIVPIVLGLSLAVSAPLPDLVISADGRHFIARLDDGRYVLLRDRAGPYMRSVLAEIAGQPVADELMAGPGVRCSPDACLIRRTIGGRHWIILGLRSAYWIDRPVLEPACRAADIIVADRTLPRWCRASWLTLDKRWFMQHTGARITLSDMRIMTQELRRDAHPWVPIRAE